MEYRIEKDTLGEVKVPANCYWGAQTERSRNN
ncbi:MAG: fumarate hydratase class II, partial [Cyclobacteriaceae bacterium]